MDLEAANRKETKVKRAPKWICPCQGCKKARAAEKQEILDLLRALGYDDAATVVEEAK